eukprot:COSAG01_NODE_2830_length_6998_cov_17.705754_4_plen_100_part_00
MRVETMGPGTYENVGESQSVFIMINPIISIRTRSVRDVRDDVGTGVFVAPLANSCRRLYSNRTPSGGGYSIHRGGAIHIEGAVNPVVCSWDTFTQSPST